MATISSLERVSAAALSKLILAAQEATAAGDPTIAIIDVRDDGKLFSHFHLASPKLQPPQSPQPHRVGTNSSPHADYIGGHIKGSQNVPSRTLDAMLPTLVRQLQDKETVVFHCALSQQRGPGAALRYIRERERLLASLQAGDKSSTEAAAVKDGDAAAAAPSKTKPAQKVYVLDRGFVGWQEAYGTDERLTEGYRKELWQDGYWG